MRFMISKFHKLWLMDIRKFQKKSWFSRGTLLRIQGIRIGENFIPKKAKSSIYPVIMKIIGQHDGILEYQQERMEANE